MNEQPASGARRGKKRPGTCVHIERWRLTERRFHVEGSLILDEADDIERTIDGLLVDFGRLAELQARMEYGAS